MKLLDLQLLALIIGVILIMYLFFKRMKEKDEEKFEDRDN